MYVLSGVAYICMLYKGLIIALSLAMIECIYEKIIKYLNEYRNKNGYLTRKYNSSVSL